MAIALGLFIGCLPFFGFHLVLCWVFGILFRLNRLKVYVAANISNPAFAPWLVFAELQVGSWLRRGSFQSLTPQAIRATGLSAVGGDVLLGSVVVGGALAVVAGSATYALLRSSPDDDTFAELVRRASHRYLESGISAWEFARSKLRADPVYRAALVDGHLGRGGTLMDIGCGQGLMLALLAEADRTATAGEWPATLPPPPRFDRLVGIEIRPRAAARARAALGADAEILECDARHYRPDHVRAVLLFDVLHMLAREEQEAILVSMASTIGPDGVVLVREADASGGWRFAAVRTGNRLKALAFGAWRQTFHFRTRDEWLACFARHGFHACVRPTGRRPSVANLLFELRVTRGESAATRADAPPA